MYDDHVCFPSFSRKSLPWELLSLAPLAVAAEAAEELASRMKAVKLESRRAGPLFDEPLLPRLPLELHQTQRYHWTSREERKAEYLTNRPILQVCLL